MSISIKALQKDSKYRYTVLNLFEILGAYWLRRVMNGVESMPSVIQVLVKQLDKQETQTKRLHNLPSLTRK